MANVNIVEISCYSCGVSFWVTEYHNKELLRCRNFFYCPNGHKQRYIGKTDKEKLEYSQLQLRREKDDKQLAERSNAALRGVITRMKNKQKGDPQC